jgi:hypothetical protein
MKNHEKAGKSFCRYLLQKAKKSFLNVLSAYFDINLSL